MIDLGRGSGRWDKTPLTWWPVRILRRRTTANVVCSVGHAGLITDHEIAADGTVTPSVVCTQGGCVFHEFVRLVGWAADGV